MVKFRNRWKQLISKIFFADLLAARAAMVFSSFILATTFILSEKAFQTKEFFLMGETMSREAWALVLYLLCALKISTMGYRLNEKINTCIAAISATIWIFITSLISLSSNPAQLNGFATIAFLSIWIFVRSGYSAGYCRRDGDTIETT